MAEILAPAGSAASFEAALAAGADAVYLALPKFGARAYAANFSLNELKETIRKAKLHNMKVYVTMNTILYEDEIDQALMQARDVYEAGADALIVQDLGLMHRIHHQLPEMEVHASTQLSVNRPRQLEKLKTLGVTRAVLARECSLDEIRECAKVKDMEIEVFVHGALCISYSGQCEFSAVRYGRSGNRGQCAQACRMQYTLTEDGKKLKSGYMLSPKDLSVLDDLDALEKAGVDSFKIEGRMKSPLYVYESVRAARKEAPLTQAERDRLSVAFSRGFTIGHITKEDGRHLMNFEAGNHQGIHLGKVVGGTKDRVRIRLDRPLHQEDGVRFVWDGGSAGSRANFIWDAKGKLVSSARAGQEVEIPSHEFVPKGANVRLTLDHAREKEVDQLIKSGHRLTQIETSVECTKAGDPLKLSAMGITVQSVPIEKAGKRPTDEDTVIRQVEKKGSDWAQLKVVNIKLANDLFIPVKLVNELRRELIDELEKRVTETPKANIRPYDFMPEPRKAPQPLYVEIMKPDQKTSQDAYWYSPFPIKDVHKKAAIYEDAGDVVSHLGDGPILDGMNISNSYALAAAMEMGYEAAVLSPELDERQAKELVEAYRKRYGGAVPAILPVYEKRRLMIMNYCPVNTVKKDGKRENCSLCRQRRYELEGLDGTKSWLYGDADCRMQVFDEKAEDRVDELADLRESGLESVLVRLTDEGPKEASDIVGKLSDVMGYNDVEIENDTATE